MDAPFEFITLQTLAKEEVREDPETGEEYMEQIIIAKDKKLRKTVSLFDINSFEEVTDDTGSIYAKRCLIYVSNEPILVAKSYKSVDKLLKDIV